MLIDLVFKGWMDIHPDFFFFNKEMEMTQHANHVILIGKVLQTWTYDNNRIVRLQMKRSAFLPKRADGNSDLVNIVLPDAVSKGQVVSIGSELHVAGFIRSEDREVLLSSLMKEVPQELRDLKVKQIVTEVLALEWEIG